MIDAHVHLERGAYTEEWLGRFIDAAVQRGITKLYLLEHSHRFSEFRSIYKSISSGSYCGRWLETKLQIPLYDYLRFIDSARGTEYPIEVKFGLEVCYFEGYEEEIQKVLKLYDFDFLTGSVHYIDGWGFDHKAEHWQGRDVNETYLRYYEIMNNLVKSGIFNILAHPDSIKCFGNYPTIDMTKLYEDLAELLVKYGVKAEQSAGLHLNYNHPEVGMNKLMLHILKTAGVDIITASDAHSPENTGLYIDEMALLL